MAEFARGETTVKKIETARMIGTFLNQEQIYRFITSQPKSA
jgi:hypothetical protein